MFPREMLARGRAAHPTARASGTWGLDRDATLRIGRRGAARVQVQSGLVLVTREGDPMDHVLGPGMELVLTQDGSAVAWALEPSTLRVSLLARAAETWGEMGGDRHALEGEGARP